MKFKISKIFHYLNPLPKLKLNFVNLMEAGGYLRFGSLLSMPAVSQSSRNVKFQNTKCLKL